MAMSGDITGIIRVKRDFEAFLSGDGNSHGPSLSLDETTIHFHDRNLQSGNVSKKLHIDTKEKEQEHRMREAELIRAKSYITQLEMKVASLETSNKRVRIELEHDLDKTKQQHKCELDKVPELKRQLQFLLNKEKNALEQLAEVQTEADNQKKNYEQRLSKLYREKSQIQEQLQECQETSRRQITEQRSELVSQTTDVQICRNQLDQTKEQCSYMKKRIVDMTSQIRDLEGFKVKCIESEAKVKELEKRLSAMDEDAIIVKNMKSQLLSMPVLEKENEKLKDENQFHRDTIENNMLLKEQAESYKKKFERLEHKLSEVTQKQIENEDLKSQLRKWQGCSELTLNGPMSPSELVSQVSNLQKNEALQSEKQAALQSRLSTIEERLHTKEQECLSTNTQLLSESNKLRQQTVLIKRLQKKLLLVSKERDAFKRILDTYESEITVNITDHSKGRLQQQEETIQAYQKHVEHLETELQKMSTDLTDVRTKLQQSDYELQSRDKAQHQPPATVIADQKITAQLREKIAELEKKLEGEKDEKYLLECQVEERHLQGDYNPATTKVIHLHSNPVNRAQRQLAEELESLKQENERLKQRLKLLEEAEGSLENLTVKVEQRLQEPSSSKEIEDIRVQLNTAELKNKRLMEAFKKTSHEFREVCYLLLGYKIDIPCPNQYRLMSMYGESPDDLLLFMQSSSGELQLLETEYSSTLSDLIELYLQKQDCIPAFLSALTLDLFSRQTRRL